VPWPTMGRAFPLVVVIVDLGATLMSVRSFLSPVTWALAPESTNQSFGPSEVFISATQASMTSTAAAS
jgi:hypothetical protein